MVLRLCSYPEFKAGVHLHPSHSPICGIVKEEEKALLEAAKEAKHVFMPAGEIGETTRRVLHPDYVHMMGDNRSIVPSDGLELTENHIRWPRPTAERARSTSG